jgi:hypothetical protein
MALTQDDRNWIEKHFENLLTAIIVNKVDIAVLKTKAGMFGMIGGIIPIAIMIAVYFIKGI